MHPSELKKKETDASLAHKHKSATRIMSTRRALWNASKRFFSKIEGGSLAKEYAEERAEWKRKLSETRKSYQQHVREIEREEARKRKQLEADAKERNEERKKEKEKNRRSGPRVPEIYELEKMKIERKPKIKELKRLHWKAVMETVQIRRENIKEKLLEESRGWIKDEETLQQRIQEAFSNPARLGD